MDVNEVRTSYEDVKAYRKVAKAIAFKAQYKAVTGHRPSLVSVIALAQEWQERAEKAEAKLADAEEKLAQAEGDLAQAEQDLTEARSE